MIDNMTIAFAPGDIRDLQRQMRRAESVLGKNTGQAVKFKSGLTSASSFAATTRPSRSTTGLDISSTPFAAGRRT